jgi:hypothetical protein
MSHYATRSMNCFLKFKDCKTIEADISSLQPAIPTSIHHGSFAKMCRAPDHGSCREAVQYEWEGYNGKSLAASRPMTKSIEVDKRNVSSVFAKCLSKGVVPAFKCVSKYSRMPKAGTTYSRSLPSLAVYLLLRFTFLSVQLGFWIPRKAETVRPCLSPCLYQIV